MTINSSTMKSLIEIQKNKKTESTNYYFDYNRFLAFSLALGAGKISVLNTLIAELNMGQEEIYEYSMALKEAQLLKPADIKVLEKATGKSESKNLSEEIEEIINHLNNATGRKFRITQNTKKRLETLLSTGKYTVSDFKKVNVYYTRLWSSDPKMAIYLRPQTLYNTKFEERLDEANQLFQELETYKEDIKLICHKFHSVIASEVHGKNRLIASETQVSEDFCDELPMSLQLSIIHWIKQGYSTQKIIQVIGMTIDNWSKKPELAQHISVSRILDQKFPERASAVDRILSKQVQKQHKSGVVEAEEWLKKKQGENK